MDPPQPVAAPERGELRSFDAGEGIYGSEIASGDDEAPFGIRHELINIMEVTRKMHRPWRDLLPDGQHDDAFQGLARLRVEHLAAPGSGGLAQRRAAREAEDQREEANDASEQPQPAHGRRPKLPNEARRQTPS